MMIIYQKAGSSVWYIGRNGTHTLNIQSASTWKTYADAMSYKNKMTDGLKWRIKEKNGQSQ